MTLDFSLWSSFQVKLERFVNRLGFQKSAQLSIYRVAVAKNMYFWAQIIKVAFGRGYPHLHIKPSLYVWRRAEGLQIFKRNSIISIHSHFIKFLRFLLLQLQGVCNLALCAWVPRLNYGPICFPMQNT